MWKWNANGKQVYSLKNLKWNTKIINFDNYANENKTKHNKNWSYIPDHPYRILIIGGSGSGKTNLLLNLIENQPDVDKIYTQKIHTNQNINAWLIKEKV